MKKLVLKFGAVLAVLAVILPSLSACGESSSATGRTVEEIKKSGTIKIGVFSDKSPFGFTDSNGSYQGYDVVFANAIGEDLGVKVQFVATDAAARVSGLESKKVDLILANFTVTDERKEKVDFALPYMRVALGIVTQSTGGYYSGIENFEAEDKPLIIVKGTTAESYLAKNYPSIPTLKFEQYNDAQNALLDGRGSGWLTDNTEAIAFAKNNPGYEVPQNLGSIGDSDIIAPAVTKGNADLLNYINDLIVKLGEQEFFHKDYEQTLLRVYGEEFEDQLVVEGGKL